MSTAATTAAPPPPQGPPVPLGDVEQMIRTATGAIQEAAKLAASLAIPIVMRKQWSAFASAAHNLLTSYTAALAAQPTTSMVSSDIARQFSLLLQQALAWRTHLNAIVNPAPPPPPPKKGLSTAAKVGIGLGAGALLLLVVLL